MFKESNIERKIEEYKEEIKDGVWQPSIFDEFKSVLGVGASTKELKKIINREETKIRITADKERFDKKFSEEDNKTRIAKLGAGRILISLLERIAPEVDIHNVEKTSLEHGDNIVVVNSEHLQQNKKERACIKADGLITNIQEIPLMVAAADCAPVGVYDPKNQAIAVFHSGWRSTLKQICPKGVKKMIEVYDSNPEELLVVIGPYAGGAEFEVSENEYRQFQEVYNQEEIQSFFKKNEKNPSHYFLDTGQAIKKSLIKAGLFEKNIQVSQYSTMSEKGNLLFPSERIEGNKDRDSFAFMMVLKKPS
jgi:YfiH family protein